MEPVEKLDKLLRTIINIYGIGIFNEAFQSVFYKGEIFADIAPDITEEQQNRLFDALCQFGDVVNEVTNE